MANAQPLQVPAALSMDVVAVSGLATFARQRPAHRVHVSPKAMPTGYSPMDLAHFYNLDPLIAQGLDGAGQSIGIISFADYSDANIGVFDQQFNLSTGSVSRVNINDGSISGVPGPSGAANGQDEAEADIEVVQATAPRARIIMYESSNSGQGAVAQFNRIVSDNQVAVVTSSWGGAESSYPEGDLNALHQALKEGAAQGQQFFAASGDSGAFDAAGTGPGSSTQLSVDFPASDPWVTGVGGTTLNANGSEYGGETVWSDGSDPRNPVGSGGGLSDVFSRPAYQAGPGVDNQYSNGMRQVPDVAANADPHTGYLVYTVNSRDVVGWHISGGTSLAAPLWAGVATEINQALGRRVGFLNPSLYRLGQLQSTFARSPFHDITQGDNLYYRATPGWDFATGWGSFDGAALVNAMKTLPAAVSTPGVTPATSTPAVVPSPTPTRIARPVATPTSVAGESAPTLVIKRVILTHRIRGKLIATTRLRVGEQGTIIVQYRSSHAGSLRASGRLVVRQHGRTVLTIALRNSRYAGAPALSATVRFNDPRLVGSLLAHLTVTLGPVETVLDHSFALVLLG